MNLDKIAKLNPVPVVTKRGTDYFIQISPNDRDELVLAARLLEKTKKDLEPLLAIAPETAETWGANVCAWAAELIVAMTRLLWECDGLLRRVNREGSDDHGAPAAALSDRIQALLIEKTKP